MTSSHEFGKQARQGFLDRLAASGVTLRGRGKRYRTGKNQSVGIAAANERPVSPDKWFLGLKDEPTDVLVLLCFAPAKEPTEIVIPIASLGFPWEALSRDRNGNLKFHVRKEIDRFSLDVPGTPTDITRFVGDYGPLR